MKVKYLIVKSFSILTCILYTGIMKSFCGFAICYYTRYPLSNYIMYNIQDNSYSFKSLVQTCVPSIQVLCSSYRRVISWAIPRWFVLVLASPPHTRPPLRGDREDKWRKSCSRCRWMIILSTSASPLNSTLILAMIPSKNLMASNRFPAMIR